MGSLYSHLHRRGGFPVMLTFPPHLITTTVLLTFLPGNFDYAESSRDTLWIGVVLFAVGFAKGYGLIWVLLRTCPSLAMATASSRSLSTTCQVETLGGGSWHGCDPAVVFYGHQGFLLIWIWLD